MKHWSNPNRLSPVTSLVKTVIAALLVSACGAQKGERGLLRDLFSDELPVLQARYGGDAGRDTDGPSSDDSDDEPSDDDANDDDANDDEPPIDDETNSDDPSPAPSDPDDDGPDPVDSCGDSAAEAAEVGRRCEVGVGGCLRTGWVRCVDDEPTCDVVPGEPVEETCNGRDDDCDGEVDEDIEITTCTAGSGVCERTGSATCVDGRLECDAVATEPSIETCNGLDDDCDGSVDELYYFNERCSVGVGACSRGGTPVCTDGVVGCDAEPGAPSDELCNGDDDDCDGEIDEGFDVGSACSAGVGECAESGIIYCLSDTTTRCSARATDPSPEQCNDKDDDCDGAVDDGNVCPDTTVRNTLPFDGGVWYTASTSQCGGERVLQFWPTVDEVNYYSDFPCYARWWLFRQSDGELFTNGSDTLVQHAGGANETLDTVDCTIYPPFGFDGQDQLHYRCHDDGSIWRGTETQLATGTNALLSVRSDGRILVEVGGQLQLLGPSGAVEMTYDPRSEYDGTLTLVHARVTRMGNDLFVLYARSLHGAPELVLLRIDASNTVLPVRRVPLAASASLSMLPTPDGAIFEMVRETTSDYMIRRYAPDNSEEIVWRESETTFTIHATTEMLIGPRQ